MMTTRHSLMAKGIMVLLSLLVLIFAFTYSWFSEKRSLVSAGAGSDFKDNTSPILLRSIPVTREGVEKTYDLLYDFNPKDVTGNGSSLFIPVLTGNSSRTISTGADNYTEVTPNKEYISFDLIFQSGERCNVYLDTGSYVKAACEDLSDPSHDYLTETTPSGNALAYDNDRKSSYGYFSADAIVGAVRVAFIDYNSDLTNVNIFTDTAEHLNSSPEVIWLPRPDIYLHSRDGSSTGWELITGITEGQETATLSDGETEIELPNTYKHSYYDLGVGGTKETITVDDTVTECNSNSIVPVNIELDQDSDGVTEFYGKVRVNIWIEGTDAEARRAISGGQFYVNLDLRSG